MVSGDGELGRCVAAAVETVLGELILNPRLADDLFSTTGGTEDPEVAATIPPEAKLE
jgi:hypothetical protein